MAKATRLNTGLRIGAGTPYSLTMPSADASGALTSNGSGTLSWSPTIVKALSKTAHYTISETESNIFVACNATSGAMTITLRAASGLTGYVVAVKKTDASANAVTIDGNSSETIDGATTKVISKRYDSLSLVCDGSNWHIF
jgi:hypothetical protein